MHTIGFIDAARCADYLSKNASQAVFLSPCIGYLEAAKVANRELEKKRNVREDASEKWF